MSYNTVKAKTYWTWTKLAESKNPNWSKEGTEIWPHYRTEAPKKWLEDGLIQDASEVEKGGQVDLFDILA
ncbi:hypothetical protein BK126_04530 [Paenibacillus sp. FSL H7-0326]|uniref:hypothetical protein n=1 Tax=Paenibacillus sp. FSL H7-0326 TaxID=1921144 RepID=UPI00096CBE27|nr:hypothetical protein [Paenibacillus sp. FSL H7-0326]OMC71369.1 hypothetical protein BK126_04530 [Paenibacillus sp. FSL H7-0326]